MIFWGYGSVVLTVLLFSISSGKTASIFAKQDENRGFVNDSFDYVVLGGGTAGLVIASRLSENPRFTVAVIEAGDFERNNPNVTNPSVYGLAKNTRVDWEYGSKPQIFADNRTLVWSAGKGVGGSSLINGKISSA